MGSPSPSVLAGSTSSKTRQARLQCAVIGNSEFSAFAPRFLRLSCLNVCSLLTSPISDSFLKLVDPTILVALARSLRFYRKLQLANDVLGKDELVLQHLTVRHRAAMGEGRNEMNCTRDSTEVTNPGTAITLFDKRCHRSGQRVLYLL